MVGSINFLLRLIAVPVLACSELILIQFHAQAEPAKRAVNVPELKTAAGKLAASGVDLLNNQTTAPARAMAQQFGTDHRHAPMNRVAKVDNVSKLKAQVMAGINTKSADLRMLLRPGTIIHFWASWCHPCAEEIPQLERFYREKIVGELRSKGIRLIAISNDRTITPAARFIRKHRSTFPNYLDEHQTSNLAIVGQRALPSTVLVDAGGRFHRLALGKLDWDFPDLARILTAMAARKPVVRNNAKPPAN